MPPSLSITRCVTLLAAVAGLATALPSLAAPMKLLKSREAWPNGPAGVRPRIAATGQRAAISLKGVVSGAQVRPVEIDGAYRALDTARGAVVSDLTVDGLQGSVLRECLSIEGDNILIRGVRCRMAASPQRSMHDLPEGIHIRAGSNIRVENSEFNGFQMTLGPSEYWNGDGVAAEAAIRGLTLVNVTADNNTDAGFDIKAPVVMDNVSASGNCRNYRLWSDARVGTMRVGNVVKRGGSAACAGIWIKGAKEGPRPKIRIANLIVRTATPMDIIKIDGGSADIIIERCSIAAPDGTRLVAQRGKSDDVQADKSCRLK